jgi:hypothetical protein
MAAVSNAVGQQADATFERQFAVGGPLDVEVATGSGAIAVRHSESGEVRVRGSLHIRNSGGSPAFFRGGSRLSDDDAEELIRQFETDPPVELAGGRLRVGSDDREWQHGVRIDYEIEVPAASAVTARTGSGRLEIDDIDGDVTARTGSGSIRIGDVAGRVQARSGSGAITASSIAGDFEGHAGSGSMDISLVGPGDVTVSTGSGSIDVDGVQGGLSARTGSGGVTVAGRPAAEWNLTTGSGSVRLRLPNDAQFELDAKAGSGGVSSDHPVTVQGAIDRGRLTGQVRGGGPLVVARTGSGGIRIE